MSTSARTRNRLLAWATLCLAVLVALSVMVRQDWPQLDTFDESLGGHPAAWTFGHPAVLTVLLAIEDIFSSLPMTGLTVLVALALASRKHLRAAGWTVGVMLGASLTTYLLKRYFERGRPVWEDPIHQLSSFSFPSGHATGIAAGAGVGIVLTVMLVRRRGLRRLLIGGWLLLALLIGADRILLGVHTLSDVIAGYAVGAFWVLVGTSVFDPRRAPRSGSRSPARCHAPSSWRWC